MDIGLARVSTPDQNPQLQLAALGQAGCWPIYEERVSGKAARSDPSAPKCSKSLPLATR